MTDGDENRNPDRPGRGTPAIAPGEPHPLAAAVHELAASIDLAAAAHERLRSDLGRFAVLLRTWGNPPTLASAPARPPAPADPK